MTTTIRSQRMIVNKVLFLFLVAALLAVGLAWLLQAAPAQADGVVIQVPGDYNTVQEAIDAAQNGDEIQVQSGEYFEHLVIENKSVMLTGGWNVSFTQQTKDLTTINAGGSGRGLVVYSGPTTQQAQAVTVSVVISAFRFMNGDATGLGGVITPTVPNEPAPSVAAAAVTDTRAPQERAAELHAGLVTLAGQGNFPGGATALDKLQARADELVAETQAELAALPPVSTAGAGANGEIDCGGGIYVNGAYLQLLEVFVSDNVASRTGPGAGGGLCAVNIPDDGLTLLGVGLNRNVATRAEADGFGGGLYFDGSAAPATGSLGMANIGLSRNRASLLGWGYGGGAFITGAPEAEIKLAVFARNVATVAGQVGRGGGLYLLESPNVLVEAGVFELNTAATTQSLADPMEWVVAKGGGIYVHSAPGLRITNVEEQPNLRSLFVGNIAAYNGLGHGGALAGEEVPGIQIENSDLLENWGALYVGDQGDLAGGGAVSLKGADGARIVANTFRGNVAGVYNLDALELFGGAVDIGNSSDVVVADSTFLENAAGITPEGGHTRGGAVAIGYGQAITVTGNTFTENRAELGFSGGLGGALYLRRADDALVHHNRFIRNRAGQGAGIGGALVIEVMGASGTGTAATGSAESALNNRMVVSANSFEGNVAATTSNGGEGSLGGAVAINATNGLTLTNNILTGNVARAGAGLALVGWDSAEITHDAVRTAVLVNNTLVGNPGENGVYLTMWTTPIALTNNIVVSHTLGIFAQTDEAIGPMTATVASTVYNDNLVNSEADTGSVLDESGVITKPVAFVDREAGNYSLLPTSSAINAGQGIPPAPGTDIEGTVRPYGFGVDIGAYEWHGPRAILPSIMKPYCPPRTDVGWAAGRIDETKNVTGGAILNTVDGGATWQVQLLTPGVEYFGSQAVDAQNAWVAGNPGVILRTRDGGKTWERQALPDGVPADVNLGPIVAVDGMHAWTNGESKSSGRNYWLHTVDGATWQITPIDSSLPITVGFQDMSAVDATHVWGAGTIPGTNREGGVVGFFDGQKWTRQAAGEFKDMFGHTQIALIGINAYDATHAWVVGGVETAVYQTIDGTNWFTRSQSWIPTGDTNTVVMADTLHGWAGGDHGVLYYTTDNWATFEKQGQFDGTFATISAKDANTAWATTYTQMVATGEREEPRGGRIVRTCDGGQTWEKQVPLEGYEFINISFVGARR